MSPTEQLFTDTHGTPLSAGIRPREADLTVGGSHKSRYMDIARKIENTFTAVSPIHPKAGYEKIKDGRIMAQKLSTRIEEDMGGIQTRAAKPVGNWTWDAEDKAAKTISANLLSMSKIKEEAVREAAIAKEEVAKAVEAAAAKKAAKEGSTVVKEPLSAADAYEQAWEGHEAPNP